MNGDAFHQGLQLFATSFMPMLLAGVKYTIPLTLLSFFFGLLVAMVTAMARLSGFPPLVGLARLYVWVIRGTPLLVQLWIIYFGLPDVGITLNAFAAGVIGFSISVGAYNSEVIRAAIQSIPKGQWEAAHSLGMTHLQALRRIIVPQAARVSIPPLYNSFMSLIKDTSLAASITVIELFETAQQIVSVTPRPLLLYCEAGLIYLIFSTVLSLGQGRLERWFGRRVA